MTEWAPGPGLAAYHAGVTVICELAAQFSEERWGAPTPYPEWRAADLAGHLRCVADDYHEYLDDAPASRLARLMAPGPHPESLARKLARQNTAELAALAEGTGQEHIAVFAAAARAYARRAAYLWDLPHHRYRDTVVTVGGMAGAVCVEWHLHAWDLAWSLGKDYRPADAGILVAGWQAGMPHLPLDLTVEVAASGVPRGTGGERGSVRPTAQGGGARPLAGSAGWRALLRASGRVA